MLGLLKKRSKPNVPQTNGAKSKGRRAVALVASKTERPVRPKLDPAILVRVNTFFVVDIITSMRKKTNGRYMSMCFLKFWESRPKHTIEYPKKEGAKNLAYRPQHSENHKRTSLDGFNLERPGSTAECSLKHLVLDNLGRGGRRSMLVQGQLQAQVEPRVGPLEGFEQHTLVVP